MITIKINGNTYECVNTWEEMTLNQFVSICKLNNETEGTMEDFTDKKFISIDKRLEFFNILCVSENNAPRTDSTAKSEFINQLKTLSFNEFSELENKFVFEKITKKDFINTHKDVLILSRKKYKVYNIEEDFKKIQVAEMILFENLLKEATAEKKYSPMELAFALLLRELNEDKSVKPLTKESFYHSLNYLQKEIKLIEVKSFIDFFLRGGNEYLTKTSPDYLKQTKPHQPTYPLKKKKPIINT